MWLPEVKFEAVSEVIHYNPSRFRSVGTLSSFLIFFLKYKRGNFRTKYPLGMKSETAPRRKETVWEVPTTHSRMQMLAPTPTKMTRMVLGGNSIQYKLDIKSPPVMKLNWIYVGLLIKRTKP